MKSFSATLIVLGILFYVACNIEGDLPSMSAETLRSTHARDAWRRTVQGWENTTEWEQVPIIAPEWAHLGAIHPALVAALQVLISLGALLAWAPSSAASIAKQQ